MEPLERVSYVLPTQTTHEDLVAAVGDHGCSLCRFDPPSHTSPPEDDHTDIAHHRNCDREGFVIYISTALFSLIQVSSFSSGLHGPRPPPGAPSLSFFFFWSWKIWRERGILVPTGPRICRSLDFFFSPSHAWAPPGTAHPPPPPPDATPTRPIPARSRLPPSRTDEHGGEGSGVARPNYTHARRRPHRDPDRGGSRPRPFPSPSP